MYILSKWELYSPINPPDWMVSDPVFSEVVKAMEIFGMGEEEFDLYWARRDYQIDKYLMEQDGYDRGKAEGISEGELKGKAEGKAEGKG